MQLRKMRLENQMLVLSLVISALGLIIFLSLIPVNKWLWAGWMFGSVSIFIGHGASILLVQMFLKKQRSKKQGFLSGIGRTAMNIFFQAGMFFVVIAINTSYHHVPFMNSGVKVLADGPIVFYTYIGGISIMAIAVIATLLINKKKEGADERIRR